MTAPIGMKVNTRRSTDPAAGIAVRAGTIASRNGSAAVTPIPFRNVRRGSAFFVMIIAISSFERGCY